MIVKFISLAKNTSALTMVRFTWCPTELKCIFKHKDSYTIEQKTWLLNEKKWTWKTFWSELKLRLFSQLFKYFLFFSFRSMSFKHEKYSTHNVWNCSNIPVYKATYLPSSWHAANALCSIACTESCLCGFYLLLMHCQCTIVHCT